MKQYLDLVKKVLAEGTPSEDRTGTGTTRTFGNTLDIDLREGFPLLTTKKLNWNNIVTELLWFIKGDTNTKYLNDNKNPIWNAWADEKGNLGEIYGHQWRNLKVDQLKEAIRLIKEEPTSRRILVNSWNVESLDKMRLPPCHYAFQFFVNSGKELDILVNMRSSDVFLGLPYNIASYALLNHMIAAITGLKPHRLIFMLADTHIYNNHLEQVKEQLTRKPLTLPQVTLKRLEGQPFTLENFGRGTIILEDYEAHPHIKGAVAV